MQCRAGEGGTQTVAEERNLSPLGQYGDTKKAEGERRDGVSVRPRHRTTRAAVCVSKSSLYTACGKAEEGKGKQEKTVQLLSALVLKGETD